MSEKCTASSVSRRGFRNEGTIIGFIVWFGVEGFRYRIDYASLGCRALQGLECGYRGGFLNKVTGMGR